MAANLARATTPSPPTTGCINTHKHSIQSYNFLSPPTANYASRRSPTKPRLLCWCVCYAQERYAVVLFIKIPKMRTHIACTHAARVESGAYGVCVYTLCTVNTLYNMMVCNNASSTTTAQRCQRAQARMRMRCGSGPLFGSFGHSGT